METKVYSNDVEKALKVFKRQLQKEGLFREIRRRKFYEKPSEKKKRKQREAKQKRAKARKFSRRMDN
ncbi:MAG: 30S ribosomal protein S21 [Candidatus Poribacteria bacterium]|jgi:small subunit ribosomal protein S21|nr:30S ribosomal protein S21 [Candidatus Poribacteria bacterium]MDE0504830.1 30S ribosomal protein S21 [Candidatus Poribacteria bacterium]